MAQENNNLQHQPETPPQETERETAGQGARAVLKTLRYLFASLRVIIVLGIILIFFQGVFYVRDYEKAMLFRFGELVAKEGSSVLESGRLYWAWPYPIDVVKRIPAFRPVSIVSEQFWPRQEKISMEGEEKASIDTASGLAPGQDGYLLTGDANIIHATWNVTYQISDAENYYMDFYSGDAGMESDTIVSSQAAERIVKYCLDNVVLKEIAQWSVEDVIRLSRQTQELASAAEEDEEGEEPTQRTFISDVVEERLRSELADFNLGIEIQQVSLTNLQPPVVTAQAFQEVLEAAQEYERAREQAETYRDERTNRAEGEAATVTAEAEAYKKRVVSSVKADRDYFLKVLEEYQDNPETMLVALYTDTVRNVLENVQDRYIINNRKEGQQEIRIQLGKQSDDRNDEDEDEDSME
ncbi:MAG: SPFH domain-containing protein [Lentisphaeria bacterium]